MSDDWKVRLARDLEPLLLLRDPRAQLSAYHNMPYAIFPYDPKEEFALRAELGRLSTRLSQKGKRVTSISLAECLMSALAAHAPLAELVEAEKNVGLASASETVHEVLASYAPLVDLVAERMPPTADPHVDVVFIVRAGALFPLYRTSSLMEQLTGRVAVPTVLFYPGTLDGPAGLRFMGVLDAEHNYRPKIF
jgi:hypothetical protein